MEMELFLDSNCGVYIPQNFAALLDSDVKVEGVNDWEDIKAILLDGPDHEFYWEAWAEVTDDAILTDRDGNRWRVHHDGNCWLVPASWDWDEELDTFRPGAADGVYLEPGSAYWASYIINGDASGVDDEDVKLADAWVAKIQESYGRNCIITLDNDREPYFSNNYGLHTGSEFWGGDLLDYTVVDMRRQPAGFYDLAARRVPERIKPAREASAVLLADLHRVWWLRAIEPGFTPARDAQALRFVARWRKHFPSQRRRFDFLQHG